MANPNEKIVPGCKVMSKDGFWNLIAEVKAACGQDQEKYMDKVPMLFLDINAYFENLGLTPARNAQRTQPAPVTKSGHKVDLLHDVILAGYKLTGRLDAVPAKGEVDFPPIDEESIRSRKHWFPEYRLIRLCTRMNAAAAPFYYSKPSDHVGPDFAEYTRKEIIRHADIGEEYMREMVDNAQLNELMLSLRHLQEYMEKVVKENYEHLPKNRFDNCSPF